MAEKNQRSAEKQNPSPAAELSEDQMQRVSGGAVECFLDLEGIKGESYAERR